MSRPSPVQVRGARRGDLDAIVRLERECFGDEALPSLVLRQYFDLFASSFFVATVASDLVGYAVGGVCANPRREGWLLSVAVGVHRRCGGVGRSLIERTLRELRQLGVTTVWATTHPDNRAASRVLSAARFERVTLEPDYFGETRPRIVLRWDAAANASEPSAQADGVAEVHRQHQKDDGDAEELE